MVKVFYLVALLSCLSLSLNTANGFTTPVGRTMKRAAPAPILLKPPHIAQADNNNDRSIGILVLLTVPFAWGSFEPAVRYVYQIQPAVPAILFSLSYYLVATVALWGLLAFSATAVGDNDNASSNTTTTNTTNLLLPLRGGIELGSYLFFGNGLQVLGLKTVPADRAAFLLQLTTLFVPLVQGILDGDLKSIPKNTWLACFVALVGVTVLSLDGKEGPLLDNLSQFALVTFSQGDIFVMGAALAYTFHCIRLERFAKETPALQLAAFKATTECALSAMLLILIVSSQTDGALPFGQDAGNEVIDFVQSDFGSNPALPAAVIAILWTGLVTVAYTIFAQSFGQARVKAVDANLIYTIQPICTAIFSWALLGETLGVPGYVGGGLIGSAVYVVASDDEDGN